MNIIIYMTIAASCLNIFGAQNNTELEETLLKLNVESNRQCLQQAAHINAALVVGNRSTLVNVPSRKIVSRDVNFVLFTRQNPTTPQNLSATDAGKLRDSDIDLNKLFFIFIHGSRDSFEGRPSRVKDEMLSCFDLNFIIEDWSSFSSYNLTYTRNITIPLVGKIGAKFIKLLLSSGVRIDQILIAGHSSGAQAAGFVAKYNPGIPRLIAIDPVGPCYRDQPSENRLAKTDALCVQIIHCSAGSRGVPPNYTGTLDLLINGGIYQPQCNGPDLNEVSLCSHNACYDYFIETVQNGHQYFGIPCANRKEYMLKKNDYKSRSLSASYVSCLNTGSFYVDTDIPSRHANSHGLR